MSLTRPQAVTRAMWRLRTMIGQAAGRISYEDIDSYHSDAIQRLVERIVDEALLGSPWFMVSKLTSNISAVSSNIFKIPDNIASFSIVPEGQVTANGGSGSGNPLQYLPNLEDAQFGGNDPQWEYYTLQGGATVGGAILTYKSDGSLFLPTTINLRAAVYPQLPITIDAVFTDLHPALDNDYVDILVEVAREKMGEMPMVSEPPRQSSAPA